jgi:hypothetical protein
MKELLRKGIFLIAMICIVGYSNTAIAQGDIDDFLGAIQEDVELGTQDVNTMLEGYMNPFMNGFGSGLTNGWMNTAKPHKTLGFDLGLVAGIAFVPDKDLAFSIAGLNIIERADGATTIPTLFGSDADYDLQIKPSVNVLSPTLPGVPGTNLKDEIGVNAVPYAVPQLGIGIVKGTDIKLRLLPEIELGENDGSVKVFGIGVMHDLKQHIPGIKKLPFDLSGFIGYTKIDLTADYDEPGYQNARGEFTTKAFTIQALISKKFSVITLYGGLGVNSVSSSLKVLGDYQIDVLPGLSPIQVTDPVDLSFKTGGPRLTAGFRLKLAILTIHTDYTVQKYSTLTVGVGFAVR